MAVNRLIWKLITDVIILIIMIAVVIYFWVWAKPFERGYFEFDQSIRLPYKEHTISEPVLAAVGFVLIIATVISVEVSRDRRGKGIRETIVSGYRIPGWVWECYIIIGVYIFGAACQQIFTEFAKCQLGRLRPHFYDVCRPAPNVTSPLNALGYIQDYACTGDSTSAFNNMRLSFPSAHSAFAMYTAVFFILYIQEKGKWRGSKLLRHAVQYFVLLATWYVGISRVIDHMHHSSDVVAGFLIGAVCGYLIFEYVLKMKKYGLPVSSDKPYPETELPRPAVAR